MQRRRLSTPLIIILILVLLIGGYYGLRALTADGNGSLKASGTIEATTVNVSPESGGKVKDVLADEGQSVKDGDPLLHLDDSLLSAQRAVAAAQVDSAQAALASAQTNYDTTLQNALSTESASTADTWRTSAPDQFNQPAFYFYQTEQLAAAQAERDAAETAMDQAIADLNRKVSDVGNADFLKAEQRLAQARQAFLVADQVKRDTEFAGEREASGLQHASYDIYNAALDELNAAQRGYNQFLNSQSRQDVLYARAQVVVAQQRYDTAYAQLLALQTGTQSPAVTAADEALQQARTALAQAQANLALLDTQLSKLTVYAPMSGVILTRNVEPGEFVQPGAMALTMADITQLTITVYVPEDRYGEISLGQSASVAVDSFPGQSFEAQVTHIADQAEFTPRNVQTVEGRSSTVYAIKLKVSDPQGKLKPGMPADVTFKK